MTWLTSVLGGTTPGRQSRYLCRPSAASPQLMLPLSSRAVTEASFRRHHDDRTVGERIKAIVARLAARAGVIRMIGGETVELEQFELLNHLEKALGEPRLEAAIGIGPRRRNRKPVLQLLRPDAESAGFVKVGWNEFTRTLINNEADWLTAVEGKLPDGLIAPRVRYRGALGDAEVVVTSPLRIADRGRPTHEIRPPLVLALARCLGTSQREVAQLDAVNDWRDTIGATVDLDSFLQRHGDTMLEVGLWHGDLTPWNTSSTRRHRLLWDWEFTDGDRPVGLDLLHTHFEKMRRAKKGAEASSLDAIEAEHRQLLAPALAQVAPEHREARAAAILDWYFCELLAREQRLAGEGWEPKHLRDLAGPTAAMLGRRLS